MHRGWDCEMRLNSKQQVTVKGSVKERSRAVGPSQVRIGRNQTTAPTGFGHGLPASSISVPYIGLRLDLYLQGG